MNADDSWTPLLDWADHARWNYWGVDALATDPVEPNRLYLVRLFRRKLLFLRSLFALSRPRECTRTPGTPIMDKF